ncbi:hypothetical protein FPV67DRAFT_1410129, partial [Lyophyllum atratum]
MPQSTLIARNPIVCAKFFNIYIKAFLHALLAWRSDPNDVQQGILGHVRGHYGCVEQQGRGSLHVHFLLWVTGSLDPDDLKQRMMNDPDFERTLFAYLDDAIANSVPEDPNPNTPDDCLASHPCSVRTDLDADEIQRQKRLRRLATRCQTHVHGKTCFKYCKDDRPEDRDCRFDLDPSNVRADSSFDRESGDINLRKVNGMINNYNDLILDSMACNMDIKFIGSGASAKAIIHYITDYISKPKMQCHASYVVLERASRMMNKYSTDDDVSVVRAKKLLQRCAYEMIACQELSAQQVASFVMDYEDHFTSHDYNSLYWPTFEIHLDRQHPSPECRYRSSRNLSTPSRPEDTHGDSVDITDDLDSPTSARNDDTTASTDLGLDDDINVQITQDGNVHPVSSQFTDYTMRGNDLRSLSL